MTEFNQKLDELLTLRTSEIIERLVQMPDPADSLQAVLQRVADGSYSAGQGMLVVTSVLAQCDIRTSLLQPLYELTQVILYHAESRRDPAVRDQLQIALGQIEEKLGSSRISIDTAQRRHLVAQLSRAQAMLALDTEDVGDAQALLAEALNQYEKLDYDPGIAALALDLSGLQWHHLKNPGASVEYLIQAADHIPDQQTPGGQDELQRMVLAHLMERAQTLYYDLNDYASAIRLARRAVELAPNEVQAWQLLGNALMRLEKYESAAEAYESLAALDPEELTSVRANLAVALLELGREDAALAAASESLRLRPGQVRPLVLRGQLRERANDVNGAVADLEATIELLEADRPVDNEKDPAATQAYREHWTMWFAAYHRLLSIHRRRNDLTALQKTIERLKKTGDDALSAMGHRLAGDLAHEAGRLDEARREYDMALESFELDVEARKARALLATETGDVDAALTDLARLTPRDAEPKAAIEGLRVVEDRFPGDRRVQRWLGFAYFELGDFENAEENFDAYLSEHPNDVEARRWLGLSLISADPNNPQPQKDGQRCFRGLDKLARAAMQGDDEARRSLLWVIDRLLLKFGFLNFYLASARTVLDALPGLEDLIRRLEPALMGGRDYEKRVRAFSDCIPLAEGLGLPCYASYLHALLGDIEFLLGHTQSALDHLREAQKLQAIVFTPRSSDLRPQHEAVVQEYFRNVTMEVEHLHIYDKALEALQIIRNTSARIDAASGQAGDTMGDLASILAYVQTIPAAEVGPIVQTLRDSGRIEEALAVLDRVEQVHGNQLSEREQGELLLTRGTVLGARGDLPEAIETMRKAEPLLDDNRRWVAWMNIASYAQTAGLHAEALEVLDGVDIDRAARSDRDLCMYLFLRATALEGCDRLLEAFDAAQQGIDTLESLREGLKDLELRSAWAGQRQTAHAYALAVRIAANIGRLRAAFDLTERSRSRLFIDEMVIGRGVADDEGRQLERQTRNLEEKRDILQSMVGGDGRRALRPDALIRLKELDSNLELVRLDEKGVEYVPAEDLERAQKRTEHLIEHLREKSAAHRIRTAKRLFGDVVGYEGCRHLLSELGRAVLVELVVQERDTLAFLVKAGQDEPSMVRTLQGIDVAAWTRDLVQRLTDPRAAAETDYVDQPPLADLLELIEKETDAGDLLCIVPHGSLHLVPFHALRLSNRYLIDRNAVVYAPSASVLAAVLRRQDEHKSSGAIVVGDTRGDLPYADQEARAVAGLLDVSPLAPQKATRHRLREILEGASDLRILHLACHGYFDTEDALSSGILAADDEAGYPAVLSARDLLEMKFHSDLVALSACQSGLSEVTPGDELMGLSRALLVGGTRSVLGSLWRVNDLSTSFLMRFFYEGWVLKGLSKAQALQAAQRRIMSLTRQEVETAVGDGWIGMVRDLEVPSMRPVGIPQPSDPVFASPAHWAAFTLVGDWR
jgi:CHAT domain-containing protein/Flp pilus assembly protein TadD